jgi:hypothetical protein
LVFRCWGQEYSLIGGLSTCFWRVRRFSLRPATVIGLRCARRFRYFRRLTRTPLGAHWIMGVGSVCIASATSLCAPTEMVFAKLADESPHSCLCSCAILSSHFASDSFWNWATRSSNVFWVDMLVSLWSGRRALGCRNPLFKCRGHHVTTTLIWHLLRDIIPRLSSGWEALTTHRQTCNTNSGLLGWAATAAANSGSEFSQETDRINMSMSNDDGRTHDAEQTHPSICHETEVGLPVKTRIAYNKVYDIKAQQ